MPRRYLVTEENFTVTAASDLLQVKGASNKMLRIIRWGWKPTDNVLPTAQALATKCRVLPTAVTDGSGGGTPKIKPYDQGDTAATFTALSRNTVKATTSGTTDIVVDEGGAHIYNGYEQQPEEPIYITPNQSWVFELINAAIQGSFKISAFAEVEELG